MPIKINPAPLHLAQAVIVGLCAAMSIAILGTSAHTLSIFNKEQRFNPWWLPLWPQHFDVHGTQWLLSTSIIVLVLSSVFLVFAFVPAKPTLRAFLSLGTLIPSTLLSLVSIIYAHLLNYNSPSMDTIQTWTCKYKNSNSLAQDIPLPDELGNNDFGAICRESQFAIWGTLVVFLMLMVGVGLTFVAWGADKWAARQERKEVEKEMGSLQAS
ncbi:hypothetical protein K504DRAFT_31457 [Pleomassaria siparia CBS 279.74]|uniref:MARVEL domain-containing protein n=1 Tax=Pleomassaria siparia CBS 279.74 TaxID=1314801 RepID=A0A6G1KS49_9PLEO|nr:hypothetical protein K504DRAFT_31457 [Pleomassaria siparia CBS 279.74]